MVEVIVVVRAVWWGLKHLTREAVVNADDADIGTLTEIFVESDVAEGPYASDHWLKHIDLSKRRG